MMLDAKYKMFRQCLRKKLNGLKIIDYDERFERQKDFENFLQRQNYFRKLKSRKENAYNNCGSNKNQTL
jgi:hypothetical protein